MAAGMDGRGMSWGSSRAVKLGQIRLGGVLPAAARLALPGPGAGAASTDGAAAEGAEALAEGAGATALTHKHIRHSFFEMQSAWSLFSPFN